MNDLKEEQYTTFGLIDGINWSNKGDITIEMKIKFSVYNIALTIRMYIILSTKLFIV